MMVSAPSVRHFLSLDQETVLNNRLVLGLPTLLITVVASARSWMIDLDGPHVNDPQLVTLQVFEGFEDWQVQMCSHVQGKQTLSLIDGAVTFWRNMSTWLDPNDLNDALFYLCQLNDEISYQAFPAQKNRALRE